MRHLQTPALKSEGILAGVNKRRTLLGLTEITELTSDTKLDDGITAAAAGEPFNKQSALRDLNAAAETLASLATQAATEAAAIVAHIDKLEKDPALLIAVQRHSFVEKGLALLDGPECPLCDNQWEGEAILRAHLEAKLKKSKEAQDIQRAMLADGATVAEAAGRLSGSVAAVQRVSAGQAERACAQRFSDWKADLNSCCRASALGSFGAKITTLGARRLRYQTRRDRESRMQQAHQTIMVGCANISYNGAVAARRLPRGLTEKRGSKACRGGIEAAYETYCNVMETELNTLYDEVEKDFSNFYRAVNDDDKLRLFGETDDNRGQPRSRSRFLRSRPISTSCVP